MSKKIEFKYLNLCSMFYFMLMILANVFIYRMTTIYGIRLSVGSLIIPAWYITGDIITEVYGYYKMRELIWFSLLCTGVFSITSALLVNLPETNILSNTHDYHAIFSKMPRVFAGMVIAILVGTFLNSFLLSKWKILMAGRFFWIRSLGSSTIGQFFFTSIAMSFDLFCIVPKSTLLKLILSAYAIKLVVTPAAATPAAFFSMLLKKIEGGGVYDYDIDYSPFKLN